MPRAAPASPSDDSVPATTIAADAVSLAFRPGQRLRRPAEFKRVFREGRRRGDSLFTLIAVAGPGPGARLGITVSRRVARSAVDRNRIRRLVRECFRTRAKCLPDLDLVVMAKPAAAQADNQAIAASLASHFERVARTCAGSPSS